MAQDYFAILGLTPGRYHPSEITARFLARREQLLAELSGGRRHTASRRELDALHVAYSALQDPHNQAEHLRLLGPSADPAAVLRLLIEAALEEGLLRYSRRQMIVERARELGLSEFQAHLLIAQVQYGETEANASAWAAGLGAP
ncbi:MAG: hypothetical protein AB1716_20440, partial [Planctomycetota bacterium]